MSEMDFRLLRSMPVFGGLDDDALQLIVSRSDTLQVPAGEYFFREGDPAKSLFVIKAGVVVVERMWNDRRLLLGRLRQGDCIGEMSLIDMMPRSASVRAEEDCDALETPLTSLFQLYKQDVEQYAMIMMNMGREVSRRLRNADDRLLELEQALPEPRS